ncbi:hypothetical protein PGT21_035763 [Puccinia graminis f. sp. tritici]|uniref:Pectinesterase inhibitor domain-containing protein n=2 Tax=Puccinia graminis f. sp. tritici TaxID=56615 RepID=E3KW82_PUCGT|nr:uncharacterized protein PGTG_14762 [Puccinia graminis f. sp. tritici CRL 75-36-700-3]EFP88557.1 hypothetical protein PGTG_14762 [Puccinia graminis f. sp. tritici CRL 75-36-700-3]KAA1076201.1 hypothetical protein PGTUg99_037060 [Puccinia graminis f. sp. tritici]KAA1091571.1 hypothetical protein PGT21_035763 [Puccinia graminis f. sp. tritici]
MFIRLLIALSLASLLVQGVFPNSNGDSPSSTNLRPRSVNSAHSATALKSEFSDIHGEIRNAYGPLERACKENDLKSVVATFAGFQKSFQGLANSCSKTYNQNRKSPSKMASGFVKILVEFQPLLKTLKAHPSMLKGCSNTFRGSSTSINAMVSFLKAGKADLKSEVRNSGKDLDMELFAQCGFRLNTFY